MQTHTFDSPTDAYAADKDYVRFMVYPRLAITFTVLAHSGTTPTLELYGPTGDPYLEGGHWVTGSLTLAWVAATTQEMYIAAFDGDAVVPATYTLRMEAKSSPAIYLPIILHSKPLVP